MKEHLRITPDRLRLLRESRGMSQSEAAASLGVTQAAFSKFEKGALEPSKETVEKLSNLFSHPVEFFCEETDDIPSGLIFHRKRASLPAKLRSRLEAEARLRMIDVDKMLKKVDRRSNLIKREGRSPKETAEALRQFWRVGESEPIENLVELLEKNNILVLSFDFGTDKIDGFFLSINDHFVCIALNDSDAFAPDRRRFTLAHELGHAILHRDRFPDDDAEKEADEFAAEFLAPSDAIKKDFVKPITLGLLAELKKKWKISMASALYRAKSVGFINEKTYRRLCINLSSLGFRKKEPLCGLTSERPSLLTRIVEECGNNLGNTSVQDYLNLEEQVFRQRYPQQSKEVSVSP